MHALEEISARLCAQTFGEISINSIESSVAPSWQRNGWRLEKRSERQAHFKRKFPLLERVKSNNLEKSVISYFMIPSTSFDIAIKIQGKIS